MRRHANVVNLDEVDAWAPPSAGPAPFGARVKRVASSAAGNKIGANFFEVAAGRVAVPFHAHHNNEEAIFVVRGRGTLRLGGARVELRAGDWVALPAGDAHAHQVLADLGEDIGYLCMSTKNEVDIVTYPDSGKLMAAIGMPPSGMRKMFHTEDGNVDYWDGEGDETRAD